MNTVAVVKRWPAVNRKQSGFLFKPDKDLLGRVALRAGITNSPWASARISAKPQIFAVPTNFAENREYINSISCVQELLSHQQKVIDSRSTTFLGLLKFDLPGNFSESAKNRLVDAEKEMVFFKKQLDWTACFMAKKSLKGFVHSLHRVEYWPDKMVPFKFRRALSRAIGFFGKYNGLDLGNIYNSNMLFLPAASWAWKLFLPERLSPAGLATEISDGSNSLFTLLFNTDQNPRHLLMTIVHEITHGACLAGKKLLQARPNTSIAELYLHNILNEAFTEIHNQNVLDNGEFEVDLYELIGAYLGERFFYKNLCQACWGRDAVGTFLLQGDPEPLKKALGNRWEIILEVMDLAFSSSDYSKDFALSLLGDNLSKPDEFKKAPLYFKVVCWFYEGLSNIEGFSGISMDVKIFETALDSIKGVKSLLSEEELKKLAYENYRRLYLEKHPKTSFPDIAELMEEEPSNI